MGFNVSGRGSEVNDQFYDDNGTIRTAPTTREVFAGISNGQDIYFRVAFAGVYYIEDQNSGYSR